MSIAFDRIAPVLPVRNVNAALDHYRRLGFTAHAYREGRGGDADPVYGFLQRGTIELHLARVVDLDPKANTPACYLYVSDANQLFDEWCGAGVGGRFVPPEDTSYNLREFAHVDPDGNLLRIGSELSST
jgi:catechol 2,3-dioxygenase-like lactoylglutathione lyase family enzyme